MEMMVVLVYSIVTSSLRWPVPNYSSTPYCLFSLPYGLCLREEYLS